VSPIAADALPEFPESFYFYYPNHPPMSNYTADHTFRGEDFTEDDLPKGEYENCRFEQCSFTGSDLSTVVFTECAFEDCDLSNARFHETALKDVRFKSCKLMGLRFDDCNDFLLAFSFEDCTLDYASFFKVKLKNTTFKNCKLEETEFAAADCTGVVFDNCDLDGAIFDQTNLEKADFRSAVNYRIDPENNRITWARFSVSGLAGLLKKYKIVIENQ